MIGLLRVGQNAPNLPKLRMPSGSAKNPQHTCADVDEYNSRQTMRCVETRNRWQGDSDLDGPPGMRAATTVQRVEAAQQVLLPLPRAAYMAKQEGTQEHQNRLVDEVEQAILVTARQEHWRYNKKAGQVDPVRLLASIVVEEWLNPAKYWKLCKAANAGSSAVRPLTSAFARSMSCNRQTWYTTWEGRFKAFQGYPQPWYEIGAGQMGGLLQIERN